jgi:hypothetical protein
MGCSGRAGVIVSMWLSSAEVPGVTQGTPGSREDVESSLLPGARRVACSRPPQDLRQNQRITANLERPNAARPNVTVDWTQAVTLLSFANRRCLQGHYRPCAGCHRSRMTLMTAEAGSDWAARSRRSPARHVPGWPRRIAGTAPASVRAADAPGWRWRAGRGPPRR